MLACEAFLWDRGKAAKVFPRAQQCANNGTLRLFCMVGACALASARQKVDAAIYINCTITLN